MDAARATCNLKRLLRCKVTHKLRLPYVLKRNGRGEQKKEQDQIKEALVFVVNDLVWRPYDAEAHEVETKRLHTTS